MICEDTDFGNAIVDNEELSKYLRENKANRVPYAAKNKLELKKGLEMNQFNEKEIETLLSYTSLPP
jgi:hypothetical protein